MFTQKKRWRALSAALAVSAVAVVGLAACSPGSAEQEQKTLKVWWWEGDDSALAMGWNRAIELFEEKHPGVQVEFELKTYEQMQQSGQLLLDSNDAPDVLEYLKGNATAGVVSQAGLLTDLTDVAKERGWDLDSTAQDVGLYENGVMGSGQRFGVTNYGEYVSVWYNKDLFAQHGVAVPTTLDELELAMQTFAEDGVTPIALGSQDYPGTHLLYELALANMGQDGWDAFQRFDGEVDWAAWEKAASTLREWTDRGFISRDSTGISAQDAGNAFAAGQYPMFVSGTWWAGSFADQIKGFAFDQFLFPGNTLHPGSGGNLWVVPEKARNKELAYDFIEITMSPEVQNLLGNEGAVPVAAEEGKITTPIGQLTAPRFTELLGSTEGGLGWYPDWPVPGLNDILVAQTSDLVLGNATPQQAVESIKNAYEQGKPAK